MTRAQAAEALRELLGDGDTSELGQALEVAIRALTPAVRKAAAAKTPEDRERLRMQALMRSAFGGRRTGPSVEQARRAYDAVAAAGWREREAAVPAEVRAQFEGKVRVSA